MGIISILFLAILIFFHWKYNAGNFSKIYISSLSVKLILGCCIGLIYSYYYKGGDTFVLFKDATILGKIAWNDFSSFWEFITAKPYHTPEAIQTQLIPSNSSSTFFSIVLSPIALLCQNNYWISSLYISFFVFMSIWYLFKKISISFPTTKYSFLIANFCIPSIVFWSSGIIKEAIVIGCIYYVLGFILDYIQTNKINWVNILLTPLLLLTVFRIKFYYFVCVFFFFSLIFIFLYFHQENKKVNKKVVGLILIGVTIGISSLNLFEFHMNLDQLPTSFYTNYEKLSLHESDPYAIALPYMSPTWKGVIMSLPKALVITLLEPNYFTSRHFFDYIISTENLLFLLLVIYAFSTYKRKEKIDQNIQIIILLVVMYGLLTIGLLGIASPNLGSLSRYKIGAYVFLYYIFLIPLEARYLKFR